MTRRTSTRSARPGSRPPRGRVPGSFGSLLSFRIDAELGQQPVPQRGEPGVVPVARAGDARPARSKTIRPLARTSTRSARMSASSTSWVTSSTAGRWRSHSREHQAVHGDPGQRVERAERLVQQEQAGLADQGPGQRRPLGLATGQRQRPGAGPFGQADLLQRPAGRRARRPGRAARGHVGQHPAPGQQPRLLERDRDRCPARSTSPVTSRSRPASARSRVDLPVPLTPSMATNSPGAMSRSTPSSTCAAAERAGQPAHPRGGRRLAVTGGLASPGSRVAMPAPSSPAAGPGRR